MATQIQTDAEREVAEFLAGQPSPQEILRFHPPPEVAERAHQVLLAERQNDITNAERRELDSYEYLEHLLRMIKAAAHRRLAGHFAVGEQSNVLSKVGAA